MKSFVLLLTLTSMLLAMSREEYSKKVEKDRNNSIEILCIERKLKEECRKRKEERIKEFGENRTDYRDIRNLR